MVVPEGIRNCLVDECGRRLPVSWGGHDSVRDVNFLVIAYKQMREIEAEINRRRGKTHLGSEIPLTNFRGIELRDFPAEIARLALIIAEFQCDVLYRGQKDALAEFLPLSAENWIVCGNALRLDWSGVCPPTGTGVKVTADDLFGTPLDQTEIDFANEGGETFICGNPPYLGKGKKEDWHLRDMEAIFARYTDKYGYVDYVGCWFILAAEYCHRTDSIAALVATNSICQGRQLPQLWPYVLQTDLEIVFAHHSFRWANSAVRNAGVTCVVVGIAPKGKRSTKLIYSSDFHRVASNINAYLIDGANILVESLPQPISKILPKMQTGSVPNDGGHLILDALERTDLTSRFPEATRFVRPFIGSEDFISGHARSCLLIGDDDIDTANSIEPIRSRLEMVGRLRSASKKKETREQLASLPHRFQHRGEIAAQNAVIIPIHTSENRGYLPVGALERGAVISNAAFGLYDVPLWNMALVASRLHLVWNATVCGKLETRYRYSNTLGWNTFPVPLLTEQNKADLTRCAENILLAREAHFPATIADLYDPDTMPENLRQAHEHNDEVLVSRVGVIRPPGVGIYRPLAGSPKCISKQVFGGSILPG